MDGRAAYLRAMGIEDWRVRDAASTAVSDAPTAGSATPNDWEALQAQVAACTRCDLHRSRTQTVFGVGNRQADWLVIGEAPGAEEDLRGEPFVGRAGQLLDAMLAAIGLSRQTNVYIANILKCRPPANRDPQPDEIACCEPYLAQQIALLRPRQILVVGRIAAQALLKTAVPLARLRGRVHSLGETGIPVIVTYHPAYLLRSPGDKRLAWEDLQLARRVYPAQPDGPA
ncbi:MAG: uracil-DNA glycosylase family protein [Gammaproteobacteria bacterium]